MQNQLPYCYSYCCNSQVWEIIVNYAKISLPSIKPPL